MLHTLYKFLFNAHIYSTRVFNINLSLFSQFILSYKIHLYVSWDPSFLKNITAFLIEIIMRGLARGHSFAS
jgi:hypothetical protein